MQFGYPLDRCRPTGRAIRLRRCYGLLGVRKSNEDAMRRAMIYGSVMASFNVEKFGTERVDALTHKEINQRFADFKRFTHFEEIPFERATSAG